MSSTPFDPTWIFLPADLQNGIMLESVLKLPDAETKACILRNYQSKLFGHQQTLVPMDGARVQGRMWRVKTQKEWDKFCAHFDHQLWKGEQVEMLEHMPGTKRRLSRVNGFTFVWKVDPESVMLREGELDFQELRQDWKNRLYVRMMREGIREGLIVLQAVISYSKATESSCDN
jgi:hypothetical protein